MPRNLISPSLTNADSEISISGGLWHTCIDFIQGGEVPWLTQLTGFDRDLSMAGRAMVKSKDGSYMQKLVKVERPSKVLTDLGLRKQYLRLS